MPAESGERTETMGSARAELRAVLIRFGVEILVYGALLAIYFMLVLRFLSAPLLRLSSSSPGHYSWVSLLLIVAQAVVLDAATSLLVEQLHLERLE